MRGGPTSQGLKGETWLAVLGKGTESKGLLLFCLETHWTLAIAPLPMKKYVVPTLDPTRGQVRKKGQHSCLSPQYLQPSLHCHQEKRHCDHVAVVIGTTGMCTLHTLVHVFIGGKIPQYEV